MIDGDILYVRQEIKQLEFSDAGQNGNFRECCSSESESDYHEHSGDLDKQNAGQATGAGRTSPVAEADCEV